MDAKDYENPAMETIVFMEGEQVEENVNIEAQHVEYANVEIHNENVEIHNENMEIHHENMEIHNENIEIHNGNVEIHNENVESTDINEDNVNTCHEELVIDGALETLQSDNAGIKVEEAEGVPQGQWIQEVAGVNPENIEVRTDEQGNVEYYAIPTTDGQYFAVPNHVLKEEGIALEPSAADAECLLSSIVNNENSNVLVHENIDGSNIQYYEMPQIIENNESALINAEQQQQIQTITTNGGENNEESTIIVHLGNNLTIDEKGQIHSSASEYFPAEGNGGGEGEEMETSEVQFYDEPNEEICGDQMIISEQDQNDDDEQFDDGPQKGGEIFILSTLEELEGLLQEYCTRTSSQFVGSSKSKNFGSPSSECVLTGHQISWCDIQNKDRNMDSIIKFDGVPYMIVGTNILHCQFGTNKSAADRERRKAKRAERGIDVTNHDLKYPTKKCGCPAKVNIKQIIRFPEFKIEKDTGWKRRDCAGKLRLKLHESRESVVMEMRFVGRLPDVSEHKYHESLQDLVYTKELVLQDLVVKAQNLWLEGKSNVEIFDLIRNHVINEMFFNREPPDVRMKRYYPTKKDIRNYITRVFHMCKLRDSQKEDIKSIINEALVEECGANVSFDFNEKSLSEINDADSSDEETNKTDQDQQTAAPEEKVKKNENTDKKIETFLFVFQTPTQQRLLKKYNNSIFIVEIEPIKPPKRVLTYNMYGILVQTNVDYQIVGIIISSKLRKDGLQEGLVLFREWNAFWNPKYFLVDWCEAIHTAVTNVFPDAVYFLNPHSCEKKWLEFIKTPSNNLVQHTDELIKHLKNMQYSLTEESLSVAALVFEQSPVWQNSEEFRTWFQTKWLPVAKYWVMGYRPEDLLILQHIKSSIESSINVYGEALYQSAKYDGFIELLKSVTTVFPKLEYQKYMTRSNEAYWYYKQFSSKIGCANFMQGVPISIIPYVLDVCELAQKHDFTVNSEQMGVFNVEYQPTVTSLEKEPSTLQTVYDENLGVYIVSDENATEETNSLEKEVVIKETVFGWIECSKAMEPGEHTVSFGDMTSYPFCTCSHWMLYRLPCVHMFVVFIKVPGWRYDMISPLYRFSAVLHIDCSCVVNSQLNTGTDVACQSELNTTNTATQTQLVDTNIFEQATNFKTPDLILGQAKEFFLTIKKNAFLFRNKMLHSQLCCQLDKLVSKLYAESAKNKPYQFCLDELGIKNSGSIDNRKPLKICSLNLQSIKKFSDSNVSFQYMTKSQTAPKMGEALNSTSSRSGTILLNSSNKGKRSTKKSNNVTNTFLVKTLDEALNAHLSKNDVPASTSRSTKSKDLGFGSTSSANIVKLGGISENSNQSIIASSSNSFLNKANRDPTSSSNPASVISNYLNSVNLIAPNSSNSSTNNVSTTNTSLSTVLNLLNGASNEEINDGLNALSIPTSTVIETPNLTPVTFLVDAVKTDELNQNNVASDTVITTDGVTNTNSIQIENNLSSSVVTTPPETMTFTVVTSEQDPPATTIAPTTQEIHADPQIETTVATISQTEAIQSLLSQGETVTVSQLEAVTSLLTESGVVITQPIISTLQEQVSTTPLISTTSSTPDAKTIMNFVSNQQPTSLKSLQQQIDNGVKVSLKRTDISPSMSLTENASKRIKALDTLSPPKVVVVKPKVTSPSYVSQNKGKYTLRRKLGNDDS